MLMYRRRSVGIPEGIVLDSEIPDEIAKAIAKDNKEYNINKAAFRKEQATYSLRIFQKNTPSYKTVKVNCDESIKAVTHAVHASIFSTFSESKGRAIPRLDCIRLRQYDTLHNIATAPLTHWTAPLLSGKRASRGHIHFG